MKRHAIEGTRKKNGEKSAAEEKLPIETKRRSRAGRERMNQKREREREREKEKN